MLRYGMVGALLLSTVMWASCCEEPCPETSREQFQKAINEQLRALDVKIAALKADAVNMEQEARVELEGAINRLMEMKEEARSKLNELMNASSEAWKDIKPALEDAVDGLEEALENALSRFD